MIPVAVSVPDSLEIKITMEASNWAFGDITGQPRD